MTNLPDESTRSDDAAPKRGAVVRHLPIGPDDAALANALRDGHSRARAELYDRHAAHVRRVLVRVIGSSPDLDDLLHDTFAAAFTSTGSLADGSKLRGWLTSVAIYTARGWLRRQGRRRWLVFTDAAPERQAPVASGEVREALRETYAILDRMRADERVAFALRYIDGMQLEELAAAARCSLSTIKRRLARAERTFTKHAKNNPALASWLAAARRWGKP